MYEGNPDGPLVASAKNEVGGAGEIVTVELGESEERVLAIQIVGMGVTPDTQYSGNAFRSRGFRDCTYDRTDLHLDDGDHGDPYAPENRPIIEIPVVVHVLMSSTGLGDLSDARIRSQIDAMNYYFRGEADPDPESKTDVRVRFRLAEITRTTNDFWFQDTSHPLLGHYRVLARDPRRFFNIYTNNFPLLGIGGFPDTGNAGSAGDGVVINYLTFGRPADLPQHDLGEQTVHETGHYLGLRHTDGEQLVACPAADECFTNGDLICDTPPSKQRSIQCVPASSCGYSDPIHNFMNYGPEDCLYEFTPQQAGRMRCALERYRPDLGDVVVIAGTDRKVSGGGQLDSDPVFGVGGSLLSLPAITASASRGNADANFALLVRGGSPPTGHLTYRDKGTGDEIKATAFDADGGFEIVGTTHARVRGTATVNGVAGRRFEVELDDAGEASGDAFSIRILEDAGYRNGGPLLHGNIRIH